jgi:hypothetical protein
VVESDGVKHVMRADRLLQPNTAFATFIADSAAVKPSGSGDRPAMELE